MGKITIIAEIGINHGGDMDLAKELIRQAKDYGADVAKTQLFEVDKFYSPSWEWYEAVKRTQLSKEQTFMLADHCQKIGIEFLASAHDLERLAWCEEVGMKRHKVATSMNKNKELIEAMLATGKEVLISCQQWHLTYHPPAYDSLSTYYKYCRNIKYLYCIPLYPTPLNKLEFGKVVFPYEFEGFSDHTIGAEASVIAMARGATIIEKHFTLDKTDKRGPDHICSVEPDELKQLVRYARKIEEVL